MPTAEAETFWAGVGMVALKRGMASTVEEWLAATMAPAFTVEELVGPDWPDSLKDELCREAKMVNGFTFEDAVGNS